MEKENQMEVLDAFNQAMDLLEKYDGVGDLMDLINANLRIFGRVILYEKLRGSLMLRFAVNRGSFVSGSPHYFFEGIGRNLTDFISSINPTELGMCLDINDDGSLKQSVGGSKGGFSINLNTNSQDYLPTTSSHGFIVFIRDQDESVMMNQGGYIISPGSETFLKLTSKSTKRLGPPHGTCRNVENIYSKRNTKFESIRECWQRQAVDAMIHNCACIPIYFAGKMWFGSKTHILDEFVEIIKPIRAQKQNQFNYEFKRTGPVNKSVSKEPTSLASNGEMISDIRDKIKIRFINSPYYEYTCGLVHENSCSALVDNMIRKGEIKFESCPEPCQYNEWEVVVTSSPFPPTPTYFNKFLKNREMPTFEQARDNIARLHVYYDDIRVQETEQKPAYKPQNFIAEFGGTVDLFIGFSFFTVLQLIEIGIAACFLKWGKRKREEMV